MERIRGYERAGLDRLLIAFPRDRAGEMITRLGGEVLAQI
jgi:hypothetical protein